MLAVVPFNGPGAKPAEVIVVRTLRKKAQIVPQTSWTKSARKLFAPSHSAEDISAVAEDVGAQIVITGLVKRDGRRWELTIGVRDGKTGKTRDRLRYPLKGPRMSPDVLAILAKEIDTAFDAIVTPLPGGAQPTGESRPPTVAKTEPKPAETRPAETQPAETKPAERPAETEADGGRGPAGAAVARRRTAAAVGAGAAAAGGARQRRGRGARRAPALGALLRPLGRPDGERPLVRLRSGVAAEVHLGRRRRHPRRRDALPARQHLEARRRRLQRPRRRRHRRQALLARLDVASRTRRRSSRPTSCASRAGCAGASCCTSRCRGRSSSFKRAVGCTRSPSPRTPPTPTSARPT